MYPAAPWLEYRPMICATDASIDSDTRRILADHDQRFPEVATVEHRAECLGRAFEPDPQVFFVFHASCLNPAGHLVQEPVLIVGDETADAQIVRHDRSAFEIGLAGCHPRVAWIAAV